MPPQRYDLALDMTGLRSVAHYDPADLTLSVDAGLSVPELTRVLAAKNQFLPLAVPCGNDTTIGGAVASGIDSALRLQYGTARDLLIGAEFVDGAGQLCKSGGRVVKNVTGYDLHKLLVGSHGTLAAITRLNFRTFPLPELRRGHIAAFSSLNGALEFRSQLLAAGLPLANLECVNPEWLELLPQSVKEIISPKLDTRDRWIVYAAFAGNGAVVQRVERELQRRAEGANAMCGETTGGETNQQWSDSFRDSFDWLRGAATSTALFRIVLPSNALEHLVDLHQSSQTLAARKLWIFRPCGVTYFALMEEKEGTSENLLRAVSEIHSGIDRKGGSATLLHAPPWLKQRVNAWGPMRPDFALMQRVKRAFDPQNVFAPGRFVGGL
jgi:glycolate oxidase FAD binding subunit